MFSTYKPTPTNTTSLAGMNVTTTTGPSSNPTVTTAQYYFIKNLQGDIVAMADATGAIKCSYTYNSWGKVLSIAGPSGTPSLTDHTNPANINPFRYRGYYYDGINEIYWLQSRFYDPNTGRFLNADGYVSTGQGLLSTNMFLYCGNNPVNKLDYSGNKPGDLFDTIDEPALDFALCYNALSISDMQEYGSAIYKVTSIIETKVTIVKYHKFLWWEWTTRTEKTIKTIKTQYSYTEPAIGKQGNSVTPNIATLKPIVSTVHTHANYDPKYDNENFSTGFASDIGWSNFFHMDSYVVTPGGFLKKYTYADRKNKNGGISIISNEIPWDVNSPDHID